MATPATIHVQLWHGGCRLYCHPLATGLSRPNARPVDIQLSSANSSNIPTFDLATQELSLCRQLFVHDYICSKINQFETRRVRSIRSTVDSESQKTKSVNFLAANQHVKELLREISNVNHVSSSGYSKLIPKLGVEHVWICPTLYVIFRRKRIVEITFWVFLLWNISNIKGILSRIHTRYCHLEAKSLFLQLYISPNGINIVFQQNSDIKIMMKNLMTNKVCEGSKCHPETPKLSLPREY